MNALTSLQVNGADICLSVGILPVLSAYQLRRIDTVPYSALTGAVSILSKYRRVGVIKSSEGKMKNEARRGSGFPFHMLTSVAEVLVDASALRHSWHFGALHGRQRKKEKKHPHSPTKAASDCSCSREGLCQHNVHSPTQKVGVSSRKSWPVSISVVFHTQDACY